MHGAERRVRSANLIGDDMVDILEIWVGEVL